MSGPVGWPAPPREPGPWIGGPPVAPPGNTPLPPLPGPEGLSRPGALGSNPFPVAPLPVAPPPPPASGPRPPFPGLHNGPVAPVDRAPRWILAVAAVVVLALVAGAALLVVDRGSDHPSAWDDRVDPIAEWVANQRQLDFDHPVQVNFLSEEDYREAITGGEAVDEELSAEDEQASADLLAQFRALGFISGEVDLDEAGDTLSDSGTLAYYDTSVEEVFVRGTELTPDVRVTLAHELVHVLQDQNFDLDRLGSSEDGTGAVLRSLAEGDAERVENAYIEQVLTPDERATYEASSEAVGAEAEEAIDGAVPPILTALFASPYVFGPELVGYLERSGGNEAVDDALRDPPTEEVLFNPLVHDTDAAEPADVEVAAPEGAEVIDEGDFGATTWYLLLASRMEPTVALEATDGLSGDAYVVYRTEDRVCVRINAGGDTREDLTELSAALQTWVAESPGDTASARLADDVVEFRSCDPGAAATVPADVTVELLQLPVLRTQIYDDVIEGGGTAAQGACFAEGFLGRFTYAQIVDDAYLGTTAAQEILTGLQASCR